MAEADRFWTRFQISLALNGGLLVAYSAIFGIKSEAFPNQVATLIGPLAISCVGIALSIIWQLISTAGAKWQDYWVNKGAEIEKLHDVDIKVRIFTDIKPYEKVAPVRKIRTAIPVVFLITWSILFLLILVPLITNLHR